MTRSLRAVLLGNFTLRFSTGLTGTLLLYYLADLPQYGGVAVSAVTAGILAALYFAAELILSPLFGAMADRFGTHRMMQPGPILGGVAVIGTALTTSIPLLAGTRFLEGAAAAASVPAALGYIAIATSRDQALRGRVVARFEVATLGGVGVGSVVAGFLYSALGPTAFFVNAVVYAVTFVVLRYGVDALHEHAPTYPGEESVPASLFHLGRYREVLRSRPVWFLAPTWIALNALLGSWGTQAVFQLVQEPSEQFSNQVPDAGTRAVAGQPRIRRRPRDPVLGPAVLGQPLRPAGADDDHRVRAGRWWRVRGRAPAPEPLGRAWRSGSSRWRWPLPPRACSSWPVPPRRRWDSCPTSASTTPADAA